MPTPRHALLKAPLDCIGDADTLSFLPGHVNLHWRSQAFHWFLIFSSRAQWAALRIIFLGIFLYFFVSWNSTVCGCWVCYVSVGLGTGATRLLPTHFCLPLDVCYFWARVESSWYLGTGNWELGTSEPGRPSTKAQVRLSTGFHITQIPTPTIAIPHAMLWLNFWQYLAGEIWMIQFVCGSLAPLMPYRWLCFA